MLAKGRRESGDALSFGSASSVSTPDHAKSFRSIATNANSESGKYRIAVGGDSIGPIFSWPTFN
jgi:hypothetical protein